ncbi:MAG: LPS export ABC transporter ATP-binding protein [Bdellovibrionales bacterium]|jgi:lipopolysaccharide export system ATP-binding protein|nr:LPS export ABC transporter ATP-binding protein [Bdellovibrionales bacterium]
MSLEQEGAILEAKGLYKSYGGRQVVSDISIKVEQGSIVGLLGPNGAGKTTSFYMMVGLVKTDAGGIFLSNEDITSDPIHKRAKYGIGYLPQEASIFRDLTVKENIFSVLENRDLPKIKKASLLESLIEDFGLKHIENSKGRSLSGGERRRVEIARALALEPKFILLDEPFAGVDPLAINDIQNIILGLKNRKIGVLITDHNVRETLGIVDYSYIMNNGELLVEGLPENIIDDEKAKMFYLGEEFKM